MSVDLNELRARATRIFDAATLATEPSQMQLMNANSRLFMMDILNLAKDVLELFPEDDFVPVTSDWSREIGGRDVTRASTASLANPAIAD
jgi:hypothetical protein